MKMRILVGLATVLFMFGMNTAVNATTIWNDNFITFTKANYADWTLEANQDRIVSDVWLTRGDYSSLFNIAVESWYPGIGWNGEPSGTEWAFGTTENYDTLIYEDFIHAADTQPQSYIYTPAVLHLINEDIYIDIMFTEFSGGGPGGGFSYTRASAPSEMPEPTTLLLLGLGIAGLAVIRRKI